MAERIPAKGYSVNVEFDVLPLIRLAQWAAHMGELGADLEVTMEICPDLKKAWQLRMGDATFPEKRNPCELLEQVLRVAGDLLEASDAVEG